MSAAMLAPARACAIDAIYHPLDAIQHEIRILHVSGNSNKDEILDCTLQTVSLRSDPKPEYEAISYCWGELQGQAQMRVNAIVLNAPASAVKVLHRFRREEGTRALWIDALCINQADLEERAQQVSIMKYIYWKSSLCLIWLGDANPQISAVIDCIKHISRTLVDPSVRGTDDDDTSSVPGDVHEAFPSFPSLGIGVTAQDLVDFFATPWFGRVWVLQEAVLSLQPICHRGQWNVPWSEVHRTARWMFDQWNNKFGKSVKLSVDSIAGLVLCHIASRFATKKLGPLSSILTYCSRLEASDDRDRFYGTLGFYALPQKQEDYLRWLHVDYSRSVIEVSRDATRAVIILDESFFIFEDIDQVHVELRGIDLDQCYSCSWAYPLRKIEGRKPRSLFSWNRVCAERAICYNDIVPLSDASLISLKGYDVSRIAVVLTRRILRQTDGIQEFGELVNEALQYLIASDQHHLVRKLMTAAVTRPTNPSLPDIGSDVDWANLATNFVKFCSDDHDLEAGSVLRTAFKGTFDDLLKTINNDGREAYHGRRFFLTADGHIGLGHELLQEHDCLAVILGTQAAFILRPTVNLQPQKGNLNGLTEEKHEEARYRFVGLAYVPGVTQGEAIDAFEEAGVEPRTFCLW